MTITACRTSMPAWSGASWSDRRRRSTPRSATPEAGLTPLPEAALNGFPPVDEIVAKGVVHRDQTAQARIGRHADGCPSDIRQSLGEHSDERACRAGPARQRERRSRAHQAQQPAAVPRGARGRAQRCRGRGCRAGNLCAGVHEARRFPRRVAARDLAHADRPQRGAGTRAPSAADRRTCRAGCCCRPARGS